MYIENIIITLSILSRVVTGMRLANISNVIHIQIQQGKLEKFGFINSSSVHWQEENGKVYDRYLDSRIRDNVIKLDYFNRRVNLNVFYFEPNEVIIGAAFDWNDEDSSVELSVFITAFSFTTGILNQYYRKQIAPTVPREEIVLEKPHIPTLCHGNVPVRGNDKFIKFQTTAWDNDAAQTTIPYLDIQPVVTFPPTMLRGAALYYKGGAGCGGYIGLELYSHEYYDIFLNNTS